jgi:hypothetical protein
MYSQLNSTFLPDNTQAAEEQPVQSDELPSSSGPDSIFSGEAIYLRLLNLWRAATCQTPGPNRLIVRRCPQCGALSASPDDALLRNWELIHCCSGRRHVQDVL